MKVPQARLWLAFFALLVLARILWDAQPDPGASIRLMARELVAVGARSGMADRVTR